MYNDCVKFPIRLSLLLTAGVVFAAAQTIGGSFAGDLHDFVATPALPGYEQTLADHIAAELQPLAPQRDDMGDVIVSLNPAATAPAGGPMLLVAPLDEPGYIVSGITPQGYLRLQRLPTRGRLPLLNALASAQPVRVGTKSGGWINGVVTGLSVHLQPGRTQVPNPDDLDNMYVDIGASSAAEVAAAGVGILSPVALGRDLYTMAGGEPMGFSLGDRYGAAVLMEALRRLGGGAVPRPVVVAFVTQQWVGGRGLARVREWLASNHEKPASVVLVGWPEPARRGGAGAAASAEQYWTAPVTDANTPAARMEPAGLQTLLAKVETTLGETPAPAVLPAAAALPPPPLPPRPTAAPTPEAILQALIAQYGVDPAEAPVRETIERLLPPWAQPITDEAGNLVLHWGDSGARASKLLFIAHQDEIGFQVQSIEADGTLRLRTRGGGELDFYLGHPILVHSAGGMHPGVLELPEGWQATGFTLMPAARGAAPAAAGRGGRGGAGFARPALVADIGAHSAAEVAALGVAVGDTVTIPKRYRKLLGHRATARSFDDRVGDAALIAAAWALGPSLPGRDVTLAWSTGEEIGLDGAKAMAARLAAAGRTPDYIFTIDTFVSSDTPLESHRFADTPIGQGFVIRAIDDSSIAPWPLALRLASIAQAAGIPYQSGITGGGNDGSAFLPFGSIDLPLGWPLRTSHSPGEVIDTRDLDGLSQMVAKLAHSW